MSDDQRAFPILYVDDEPENLFTFRYALEGRFTVLTAPSGPEAIQVLEREDVAVLVCDQRMPGMTGVDVFRRAREIRPDTVRIMVTAYSDMQAAVDAINQGQVLRFLTKPWRNDDLIEVLNSAIELVRMRQLVHEMQARILRGSQAPALEAMARQVAAKLEVPIARLRVNSERIDDLLSAGLENWESQPRARELVEGARSVQRDSEPPMAELSTMVNRLAGGQRLTGAAGPVVCDVVRVVRATAGILAPVLQPAVRLQFSVMASPSVRIAPADLGQVLLHLLMNAAQALESMSQQGVGVGIGVVTVEVTENAGKAEIAVVDSGPGIASDKFERIFDACYSTREGAAGLGLSMVQTLVTRAGGTVRVESQVGAGARFVVQLPCAC